MFSLTGIPYGKYKFFYLYGDDWSANANFKGGRAKGNFLKDKRVGKSDKSFDCEFEEGYYGTSTGVNNGVYQFRAQCKTQKCQSVRFRISDTEEAEP